MGGKKAAGNGPPTREKAGNPDERILKVRHLWCRILHGSVSWAATFFKNVFTLGLADPIQHEFLVIETDRAYYCIQLYTDGSQDMREFGTELEAFRCGLDCAGKPYDAPVFRADYGDWRPKNLRLRKVHDFLDDKEFGLYYSLTSHNCQDFCNSLSRYLRGHASS